DRADDPGLHPGPGRAPSWSRTPAGRPAMSAVHPAPREDAVGGSWTGALARWVDRSLPSDRLFPDRQPAYVGSWVYTFGVATIAALVIVVFSGVVPSFSGAQE